MSAMMELGVLDTNREARFESMRRQSRSAQVLRRHEDLRKQCEREVVLYERAKRLLAAQCRRSQMQCANRLKTFYHNCPSYLTATGRGHTATRDVTACSVHLGARGDVCAESSGQLPPSRGHAQQADASEERFLFRVLHRNGREVYIRDETKARESRLLLNGVTEDDATAHAKPRRTQSYHP